MPQTANDNEFIAPLPGEDILPAGDDPRAWVDWLGDLEEGRARVAKSWPDFEDGMPPDIQRDCWEAANQVIEAPSLAAALDALARPIGHAAYRLNGRTDQAFNEPLESFTTLVSAIYLRVRRDLRERAPQ